MICKRLTAERNTPSGVEYEASAIFLHESRGIMRLTNEEQVRLLNSLKEFMEVIKWSPASKLDDGELALPLVYFAKAANTAAALLDNLHLEEREKWRLAVGWPGSTATIEAISEYIGVPVADMVRRPRCFNNDYDAGFFAWEQTNQTNNFDATHNVFNKYRGNKHFWTGVYDSKNNNSHWRPWECSRSIEEYEMGGFRFDRPQQYTAVEIRVGLFGEAIACNNNKLPDGVDPKTIYWRPR